MAKIWLDMHHDVQLRGNKVATFWVYDNSDQPLGRFRIGRAGIRYFRPGRGVHTSVLKSWEELVGSFIQS